MVTKKGTSEKVQVVVKKEAEYKPRIRIKVRSYDHRIIDEALKNIIETITRSGARAIGPIPLPTEKRNTRFCAQPLFIKTLAINTRSERIKD